MAKKQNELVIGLRPQYALGNNPKDRVGATKVDMTLVPTSALVTMALAMGVGARKYGAYNWRKEPIKARGYLAAALRHIQAVLDGQDFDAVEQVHHLGFAMSTCGIYLDALAQGMLIDDRPLPGRGGEMIDTFSATISRGAIPRELSQALYDIVNSVRSTANDLEVEENKNASR